MVKKHTAPFSDTHPTPRRHSKVTPVQTRHLICGAGWEQLLPYLTFPILRCFRSSFALAVWLDNIFMTVPLWLSGQPPLYGNWFYNKPDAKPAVELFRLHFHILQHLDVARQLFMKTAGVIIIIIIYMGDNLHISICKWFYCNYF